MCFYSIISIFIIKIKLLFGFFYNNKECLVKDKLIRIPLHIFNSVFNYSIIKDIAFSHVEEQSSPGASEHESSPKTDSSSHPFGMHKKE